MEKVAQVAVVDLNWSKIRVTLLIESGQLRFTVPITLSGRHIRRQHLRLNRVLAGALSPRIPEIFSFYGRLPISFSSSYKCKAHPSSARRRPRKITDMGQNLEGFCDELRSKLADVTHALDVLHAAKLAISDQARAQAILQREDVRRRIESRRQAVDDANVKVGNWLRDERAAFDLHLEQQKKDMQFLSLNERADSAEDYAFAALQLAVAASDEAAMAALEALIARDDATRAALPRQFPG